MKKEHLERIIEPAILRSKHQPPQIGRKGMIKLDLNESYFYLNDEIIEKLKKFDYFTLSSYPEYENLNSKIAKYSGRKPEEVCLTSGSDHAIQMLLSLFFHKGDQVVVPAPTFALYFYMLKIIGADAKGILYKDLGEKFDFPFEETMNALTSSSKGLLLCNPNNPLGTKISNEEVEALVCKVHSLNIPVLIDEAYYEFSDNDSSSLLDKYDNVVILRTFSKSKGLSGLRLGYVLANKNIINELQKLRLPWAVNHFAVHAGEIVLEPDYNEYFKEKIKETVERKKELIQFLRQKGQECYDTEANFILLKTNDPTDMSERMKKSGILVKNMSGYPFGEKLLEKIVRINIPSKEDMASLKDFFNKN